MMWEAERAMMRVDELEKENAALKARCQDCGYVGDDALLRLADFMRMRNKALEPTVAFTIRYITELEGAASADEERLIAAAKKAGITFFGCDTPDTLANELLTAKARVAELEAIQPSRQMPPPEGGQAKMGRDGKMIL